MYASDSTNCCGVFELTELDYEETNERIKEILSECFETVNRYYDAWLGRMVSDDSKYGMGIAFFVKCPGDKKITGAKNRTTMLRMGFKKLPAFWNPNSGNWVHPVYITRQEWRKRNKKKAKK